MLRLGWFSTGRGPGSRNLLKAVMDGKARGDLDIEIPFVFCNWDNTEEPNPRRQQREIFFDMVEDYGIPLETVSFKKFEPELRTKDKEAWGEAYGRALRAKTERYGMDLGVLAGYMLWMDDSTCDAYDMLNLHPAMPDGPKGTWQEVIWDLIGNDASVQGAMMHIRTSEHDRGDPITFCGFPIRGKDYDPLWDDMYCKLETRSLGEIRAEEGENEPLFAKIRAEGAKRELPLVVSTVKLFADGKAEIRDKRLYCEGEPLGGPYDLSSEVDRQVE